MMYSYDEHFGGVYYLFLRGMDGQSQQGVFSAKPTLGLLDEMDQLIDGKVIDRRSAQLNDNETGQMGLL